MKRAGDFVLPALFPSSLLWWLTLTPFCGSAGAGPVLLPASADTYVRTDLDVRRNDNYGLNPDIAVGTGRGGGGIPWGGADAMRIFIGFDFTGVVVPFLEAKLQLTIAGNAYLSETFTVGVYEVLGPWTEGNGAAWGSAPGAVDVDAASGLAWVGAGDGGDANNQSQPLFAPTPSAVVTIHNQARGTVIEWDITALANSWLGKALNTPGNYGVVLRDTTSSGAFRELYFASLESMLLPPGSWQQGPQIAGTPIPEPLSVVLAGSGLLCLAALRRRRPK